MKRLIANMLRIIVGFCAIDWYRSDGSLVGRGGFVYTEAEAISFAAVQVQQNPDFTYQIRCEGK